MPPLPGRPRDWLATFQREKERKTVVNFQLTGFQAADLSSLTQSRLHDCCVLSNPASILLPSPRKLSWKTSAPPTGAIPGSSCTCRAYRNTFSLTCLTHQPTAPQVSQVLSNQAEHPCPFLLPNSAQAQRQHRLLGKGSPALSTIIQTELECFPPCTGLRSFVDLPLL